MTTLITDGFDERKPEVNKFGDPLIHHIVYGALGRVDHLDDATIRTLVEVGAIVCERTVSGPGWTTYLYTSAKGSIPEVSQ